MVMNNNPADDAEWKEFSMLDPERDDIVYPEEVQVDGKGSGSGTLTQTMLRSPKLSDVQTIDKRLFPDLGGRAWLNNLMIAGIFPDLYNDLFDIIVKGLLIENQDMTLEEAVCTAEVALSVGIDREGRIDAIAILGSPQVASENEKKIAGNF
jgi:hypothetical protein